MQCGSRRDMYPPPTAACRCPSFSPPSCCWLSRRRHNRVHRRRAGPIRAPQTLPLHLPLLLFLRPPPLPRLLFVHVLASSMKHHRTTPSREQPSLPSPPTRRRHADHRPRQQQPICYQPSSCATTGRAVASSDCEWTYFVNVSCVHSEVPALVLHGPSAHSNRCGCHGPPPAARCRPPTPRLAAKAPPATYSSPAPAAIASSGHPQPALSSGT